MVVLLRHLAAIARGHRAGVDRFVDLLLPGHLFRGLLFRRLRRSSGGRFGFRSRRRRCCRRCGWWRCCRCGWRRRRGRRGRRSNRGRSRTSIRRGLGQHEAGRQDNQRDRCKNQGKSWHQGTYRHQEKPLHEILQRCPLRNAVNVIPWHCTMQAAINGLFAARSRHEPLPGLLITRSRRCRRRDRRLPRVIDGAPCSRRIKYHAHYPGRLPPFRRDDP
jgi:hypothetical protein